MGSYSFRQFGKCGREGEVLRTLRYTLGGLWYTLILKMPRTGLDLIEGARKKKALSKFLAKSFDKVNIPHAAFIA